MYDYVVAHCKAIIKQMLEVQNRGIYRIADEASYFQDHYDEYLDDPEDEIRLFFLAEWDKECQGGHNRILALCKSL